MRRLVSVATIGLIFTLAACADEEKQAAAPKTVTTTVKEKAPLGFDAALEQAAASCFERVQQDESGPAPGIEAKVDQLLVAYEQASDQDEAAARLRVQRQNMVDGCGPDQAAKIDAALEASGHSTQAEETEPQEVDSSCESKGINAQEKKEGVCEGESGQKVRVVNRDSLLRMRELNVRLVNVEVTDTLSGAIDTQAARGKFVILTLAVTNKLDSPVSFDDSQDQVALISDGKTYSEDFDAENGGIESSFVWQSEEIQPEETLTGTIVFDIPEKAAAEFQSADAAGNLAITNFSDGINEEPSIVGVIRLYN